MPDLIDLKNGTAVLEIFQMVGDDHSTLDFSSSNFSPLVHNHVILYLFPPSM
jgi:hypothetical protein